MKLNKLALTIWRFTTIILATIGVVSILTTNPFLLIWFTMTGAICQDIADKKGLDSSWAFVYGFSWGLLAWIWYSAEESILDKPIEDIKNGK